MMILTTVPENTLPYKCGERLMVCDAEETAGKVKITRCVEFFKNSEEAQQYTRDHECVDYTLKIKIIAK